MLLNHRSRPTKLSPFGTTRPGPAARPSLEPLDARVVPSTLSVGDAAIVEGNAGTQYALVSVTLDAPSKRTVSVSYATADGTARAGSDYKALSGRLTFAPGETTRTIAVPVYGDRVAETDESFSVRLGGARRARIADGRGAVTIIEDEPRLSISEDEPRLSISEAKTKGKGGSKGKGHSEDEPRLSISDAAGTVYFHLDGSITRATLLFSVSLAVAYNQAVTVDYATADGTATAGVDYLPASGTLTFAPGETTKTIEVEAWGPWLQFYVNLSGASGNALILDGQGVGNVTGYYEQPPDPGCGCTPDSPYYPNC